MFREYPGHEGDHSDETNSSTEELIINNVIIKCYSDDSILHVESTLVFSMIKRQEYC